MKPVRRVLLVLYLREASGNCMVGWGFAFGRGFVIFLWSILWAIVGGIIAVVISGGTLLTIASNPTAAIANPLAIIGSFLLGIFLAMFVSVIGLYASIVKVAVDGAMKQMEASGFRQPNTSFNLGTQPTLAFAPSPAIRFCKNCGSSIPAGSSKCPTCGANL